MKNIHIVVHPLEDGLTAGQIEELLSKASQSNEALFPFTVEENNSAAFGFIPESVMELVEFDEQDFYKFVASQLEEDFSSGLIVQYIQPVLLFFTV